MRFFSSRNSRLRFVFVGTFSPRPSCFMAANVADRRSSRKADLHRVVRALHGSGELRLASIRAV